MANLFSDDFNRSNEELGASADWTERYGDYDIVSNEVQTISSGTSFAIVAHIASSHITTADYSVQAECSRNGGISWFGVCGRRVDYSTSDSDLYTCIGNSSLGAWRLYKRVSGSWTQLDTYAATIASATYYTVKLVMNGTAISVDIDATERLTATDSALSASGDAGLCNGSGINATTYLFDDFTVDDFGVAGAGSHLLTLLGVG